MPNENVPIIAQENPVVPVVNTEVDPIATPPFSFVLKYNHKEEIITDEQELRNLAQMGRNYPVLKAKLDEMETTQSKLKLQEDATKYVEENGVVIPEEDNITYYQAKQAEQAQKALNTQTQKFLQNNPTATITPEMIADFKENGIPFHTSYELNSEKAIKSQLLLDIETLQTKLKTFETNANNDNSAVGSVGGGAVQEKEIFSMKEIDQMSREEIRKNIDKVNRSLTYNSQRK